jgi:hypothetical protein
MSQKPFKVFYVTDIHGSEICWRKFLNAGTFYQADVVIVGGYPRKPGSGTDRPDAGTQPREQLRRGRAAGRARRSRPEKSQDKKLRAGQRIGPAATAATARTAREGAAA